MTHGRQKIVILSGVIMMFLLEKPYFGPLSGALVFNRVALRVIMHIGWLCCVGLSIMSQMGYGE